MLDEVCFLSKPYPPEERRRCAVVSVCDRRNPVLTARVEYEIKEASKCFSCVSAPLVNGSEGDPKLHLTRIRLRTMQTAITDHGSCIRLDNSQLQPCPRNAQLSFTLFVDEPCGIV